MRRRTATPAPDPLTPEDPLAETPAPDAPPGEPDAEEKGPLRRCVATRESLPKAAMIRFVLGPDRQLVPDLAGRMPGRGMWLSARGDVLERALTRGAFMKAARGPVHPIPDLRATIVDGLRRRIRDGVGLARRAGQAVVGFQQAREWLQTGRAALLVQASDGSASERARLAGGHGLPVVAALEAAELGAVFGRDHAVHVAIAPGRIAEGIRAEAARLAGLLEAGSPEPPGRRKAPGPDRHGKAPPGNAPPGKAPGASPDGAEAARLAGTDRKAPRKGAAKATRPARAGKTARPGRAGEPDRPAGGPDGAAQPGSQVRASPGDGRREARPRRGGEPAVPVTQER